MSQGTGIAGFLGLKRCEAPLVKQEEEGQPVVKQEEPLMRSGLLQVAEYACAVNNAEDFFGAPSMADVKMEEVPPTVHQQPKKKRAKQEISREPEAPAMKDEVDEMEEQVGKRRKITAEERPAQPKQGLSSSFMVNKKGAAKKGPMPPPAPHPRLPLESFVKSEGSIFEPV